MLMPGDRRFFIKMYLLIASTNPLIAYFQPGYARLEGKTFEYVVDDDVKDEGFRARHIDTTKVKTYWTLEDLLNQMISNGRVGKDWYSKFFIPATKKAMINLVRMTEGAFWKGSNIFELFGIEFMLDEGLNIWFQDVSTSPVDPFRMKEILSDVIQIEFAYYKARMGRLMNCKSLLKL
jgi:hypothetical protein